MPRLAIRSNSISLPTWQLICSKSVSELFRSSWLLQRPNLSAEDHYFRGLYERSGGVANPEAHFIDGVGGDDCSDGLPADGKRDLRHESVGFDLRDAPNKLVAPADAAEGLAAFGNRTSFGFAIQELVNFWLRYAVVASGGLHGVNLAFVNPLFQRGVTDTEDLGRFARGVQSG